MKKKIAAFMYGRYGIDPLSKFMLIVYLLLCLVTVFIPNQIVRIVLNVLTFILAVLIFYRIFSRKIEKRKAENAKYLKITRGIKEKIILQRNKWKYRKTHVYKKCPYCGIWIKLRRVKGDHKCACPKCGESFDVHVK